MTVKLLTKHHLEFLSLTEGCTGLSKSTLVKMPHCWKSHVAAHLCLGPGRPILMKMSNNVLTETVTNTYFLQIQVNN